MASDRGTGVIILSAGREGELFTLAVGMINELENKSGSPLNILVVDDDVLNQRMMKLILTREGYEVSIASNGMEAFEVVKTREFDVILMDLQMPVMDGISASRQIREWEKGRKHTFIVALTASFLPEKGQDLFEAGIDNYISKPFDLDHLRHILRYSYNDPGRPEKTPSGENADVVIFDSALGVQKIGGSDEIYKELLGDFLQEIPGRLEMLEAGISSNDLAQISRGAHNLKGVSANLGMIRLSEMSGKLEKQCESFDFDAIEHIIAEVRAITEEIRIKALEYLSK